MFLTFIPTVSASLISHPSLLPVIALPTGHLHYEHRSAHHRPCRRAFTPTPSHASSYNPGPHRRCDRRICWHNIFPLLCFCWHPVRPLLIMSCPVHTAIELATCALENKSIYISRGCLTRYTPITRRKC